MLKLISTSSQNEELNLKRIGYLGLMTLLDERQKFF